MSNKPATTAAASDAAVVFVPTSTPAQDKAQALVDLWVAESLGNSAFSIDTAAWNYFQAAKTDLVARVAAALKGA